MINLKELRDERERERIHHFLSSDTRSVYEVAHKLGPKLNILDGYKEEIRIMLRRLYGIKEQRILFKNSIKNFSITEDTYRKFLREHMSLEYDNYLVNMYFMRSYNRILEVCSQHKTTIKQFDELSVKYMGSGERQIKITLENYIYFIQTYVPQIEDYFDRKIIEEEQKATKTVYITEQQKVKVEFNPKEQLKTFENQGIDIKEEFPTKISETGSCFRKKEAKDVNATHNSSDEQKIHLREGVGADYIPEIWPTFTNEDQFPAEIIPYVKKTSSKIKEKYLFFFDKRLIQAAEYPYTDGLLLVCGTTYGDRDGYDCFRWYKNAIYAIGKFRPVSSGTSFVRDFTLTEQATIGNDFEEYISSEWCVFNSRRK
jgi:hypothetical protein